MPPSESPMRLLHRHRPIAAIVHWMFLAAVPLGFAGYIWFKSADANEGPIYAMLVAGTLLMLVRAAFLRTIVLLINDDSLLVIKRPLIRLFGSYEIYAAADVRYIRYRSDVYHHGSGSSDYNETRYFLDLITTDARILNLITSSEFPLPRHLGQQLAKALNVRYEEYL